MRLGGPDGAGEPRHMWVVHGEVGPWWWDPREALVGQLGSEVGAIRWVGSSVHAWVCGGMYVKNMA